MNTQTDASRRPHARRGLCAAEWLWVMAGMIMLATFAFGYAKALERAIALPATAPTATATSGVAADIEVANRYAELLGAYIPVTSAGTRLGYHQDFAKYGGWIGFGKEMAGRIREGQFTAVLLWRPHGIRPNGAMPFDAMLHLRADSSDANERAAADERAFVTCLRMIREAVDDVAKARRMPGGRGEVWVYLGNTYQAGENETPIGSQSRTRQPQIVRRVLHPLKLGGVDGVAIDAAGNALGNSLEAAIAQQVLDEGFAFVGYEGWSDKTKPGAVNQWTKDPRMTGFLMGYWYSERDRLYPPSDKVRGQLAIINPGKPGARAWATTRDERRDSIAAAMIAGHRTFIDIWTAKAEGLTPAALELNTKGGI